MKINDILYTLQLGNPSGEGGGGGGGLVFTNFKKYTPKN